MVDENYEGINPAYATPSLDYARQDDRGVSIMKELSPREHLQEIMHWLKGEMWDKRTNTFLKIEGTTELMNAEGRDVFFHYATSILSPIVTMSNYTQDYKRIHNIMRLVLKDASIHFHLNYLDYGINRKEKITLVTTKLLILGLSAFYKAIGAGDRKAATSNITESINTLMRPVLPESPVESKKRGLFGRFSR